MKNILTLFKPSFTLFLITLFVLNACTDFDDNLAKLTEIDLISGDPETVIKKDSDLYKMISKTSTENENPTQEKVCVEFIYPLNLKIYDANLNPVGIQTFTKNKELSFFLETLSKNNAISISYPITTTLGDGTTFKVTNNEELKLAIENCSEEEIIKSCIAVCTGGIPQGQDKEILIWKIPFTENHNNDYASTALQMNQDGTLNFYFNEISYNGNWRFLLVDNQLHINIHLEGDSKIAKDWSFDKKIILTPDKIVIIDGITSITLEKNIESTIVYEIGKTGPSGGIVFYDKGNYTKGWRYIEAAPADLETFEWGCSGSLIPNCSKSEIGYGFFNSVTIANYHDNLKTYYENPSICNASNNGTVAAKKAILFRNNNLKNWFLPSNDELYLMYTNLYQKAIGNFSNAIYWSSTQENENNAKTINFKNGSTVLKTKFSISNDTKTRAIRYF